MRDEHDGDAEQALQPLQFDLHFLAQLLVERRERLVHEQQRRTVHDGAGESDPLLLPAGKLARQSLAQPGQTDDINDLRDARPDLGLGDAAHHQGKGDVVRDRSCAGTSA